MSGWGSLPNDVIRDPDLGPNALAVLLVISSHVGTTGYMLSRSLIAQESGCSVRTVQRVINELQERGLLIVEPTFHGNERGSNRYRLAFTMSTSSRLGPVSESPPPGQTVLTLGQSGTTEEEPLKKNQSRGRRASALPSDFVVTDAMRAWWASKEASTTVSLQRETEQFLDHHRAKGTTFVDWTAAWRTWMTNAIKYSNSNRPRNNRAREVVYPR